MDISFFISIFAKIIIYFYIITHNNDYYYIMNYSY